MRGAPRTDHADRMLIALRDFTPDIEDDRRGMDFSQLLRILRRLGGDDLRAEVADALQFCRQIDGIFPADDLLGDFRSDAFDGAQSCASRLEDIAPAFRRPAAVSAAAPGRWSAACSTQCMLRWSSCWSWRRKHRCVGCELTTAPALHAISPTSAPNGQPPAAEGDSGRWYPRTEYRRRPAQSDEVRVEEEPRCDVRHHRNDLRNRCPSHQARHRRRPAVHRQGIAAVRRRP